jgi:hypothetical protein
MADNQRNQDQDSSSNKENETVHNAGGPYNSGMGGTGSGMEDSTERGTEGLGNQNQGMSGAGGGTGSSGTDWGSQQGQGLEGGDSGRGSSIGTGSSRISDGDTTDSNEEVSNTSTNSSGE